MVESGRVLRGVRLCLLACIAAAALQGHATAEERPRLAAQAGPGGPASVAVPAGPFSVTQNAAGYRAANLRLAAGPTTYLIPTAEIRGTSLSRDELARILDPGSAVPLAERVRTLAASEIVIPELRAETQTGAGRQSSTYHDIRLSGIGDGRVASASAADGSFEGLGPEGPSRGTFGRMEMSEVDLGVMMALLEIPAAGGPAELRRVYGAFSVERIATEGPKGARSSIARMSGRDFRARPTKDGWIATADAVAGHTDLDKAAPAERGRVIGAMADLFDAFEVGSVEATGIAFSDAGGKEAAGRIGRVAYTAGQGGGEFRIEEIEAGGEDGRVRVASFSMGGVSIAPALAAARELAGKTAELSAAELRRLVPVIGSIRLSGIEVDAKGEPAEGRPPVRMSVGAAEFLADKVVEGLPTDMRVSLRNVSVPIAAAAKDNTARQLLALGYDRVDASLTAHLAWNEPGQELVIREISAEGAGMGSVLVRGVVGDVGREAFGADPTLAAIAWMGASARALDVVVQDAGLLERFLSRKAAEKKRGVDDLRREYGMTAAIGIPVMLGNSPAAKEIGQAVARFIARPGRLTIEMRARDGAGLGIADLAGVSDPTELLDKVEINATAE
ncbi:hypothetical protein [Enterovirga aerilata]|uniref:Uncharacterized protein n=1 Tax=Enterovirga aerilata TaxID=2730920 RepID=A0A849I7T9_9HYPH|nr:hypothetical protein [Enterovirga sp. DB1703]NNM73371.1 hypothetical protein [Enterovirga sp. DB1703]